jgi:hypothetical protein
MRGQSPARKRTHRPSISSNGCGLKFTVQLARDSRSIFMVSLVRSDAQISVMHVPFPVFCKWQSICVGEQCGARGDSGSQAVCPCRRKILHIASYLAWTLTDDDTTLHAYRPASDHFGAARGQSSGCTSGVGACFISGPRVDKAPCHMGKLGEQKRSPG